MSFTKVESQRLILRRLNVHDALAISKYRSQTIVARFQSWDSYSLQDALKLIADMKSAEPSSKLQWFQFGIQLKATKHLIGDIGFLNTDYNNQS